MTQQDVPHEPGGAEAPATSHASGPTNSSNWRLVVLVIATLTIGAVTLLLLARQPVAVQETAAAEASAPEADEARRPSSSSPRVDRRSAPKWSKQPGWATDRSRMMTFLLEAENDVAVWKERVRPTLVVRCIAGRTEVFVITTAASIEGQDGRHTVRLAFDGGTAGAEQWDESDDNQALFAADGAAVGRRIAGASTMQFGFTPYNAAPVVAEFDVRGLSELIAPWARTCGWNR